VALNSQFPLQRDRKSPHTHTYTHNEHLGVIKIYVIVRLGSVVIIVLSAAIKIIIKARGEKLFNKVTDIDKTFAAAASSLACSHSRNCCALTKHKFFLSLTRTTFYMNEQKYNKVQCEKNKMNMKKFLPLSLSLSLEHAYTYQTYLFSVVNRKSFVINV
jgi:hypothetical protein